jgi:hypothetical protein
VANTSVQYLPLETIIAQGDRCAAVMYIKKGRVSLTCPAADAKLWSASSTPARFSAKAPSPGSGGDGRLRGPRPPARLQWFRTSEMRRGLHAETALSDMNNFRKLGFLERNPERTGGVQLHRSMLSVVLQE